MSEEKEVQLDGDLDADSRFYELAFHIAPIVGEGGVVREMETIRAFLDKQGIAHVLHEEQPQLMPLAYPMTYTVARIRHTCTNAYFGWLVFEALPHQAHALQEAMRAHEHVVRHILVKTASDAPVVAHPALASHLEKAPEEKKEEVRESAPVEDAVPMTTEQMDVEIEKLVV